MPKNNKNPLIGRKIKEVRPMTKKELSAEGWFAECIVIVLDDGTRIYPSADGEGNGPGKLFGTNKRRAFRICEVKQ